MKKEIKVSFSEPIYTVKEVSILLKTDEPMLGRLKVRKEEIDRFLEWAEGKEFTNLDNVTYLNT